MEILPLVARWAHVLGAITLLGGSLAVRLALVPALRDLPAAEADRLRASFGRRWRPLAHSAIGLLLLSGFYNYLVVTGPAHTEGPLYDALLGTKMLLAFVVFFLVIVVTSSGDSFRGLRRKSEGLSTLAVSLGVLIVLISGFARGLG